MYKYVKFARENKTLDEGITYVVEKTGIPSTILEQMRPFNNSYRFSQATTVEVAVSSNTNGYFVCIKAYDNDNLVTDTNNALCSKDGAIVDSYSASVENCSYYLRMDDSEVYDASKTYPFVPLIVSGFGVFESIYTLGVSLSNKTLVNSTVNCVINGIKYGCCHGSEYVVRPLRNILFLRE